MSEFRLAPEAEAELDNIWLDIARESGSIDIATRSVEKITEHFGFWRDIHIWAARGTGTCGPACAVFRLRITPSSIAIRNLLHEDLLLEKVLDLAIFP